MTSNSNEDELIALCIRKAQEAVKSGSGYPFGAVIAQRVVNEGGDSELQLVCAESNQVTSRCDPTAHAELVAIQSAARRLNTVNLSGCVMFASGEPCPMCLGALLNCRIDSVLSVAKRRVAVDAGFKDLLAEEVARSPEQRTMIQCRYLDDGDERVQLVRRCFEEWKAKTSGAGGGACALRVAVDDDCAALMRVVNEAYRVEIGDSGVAFKRFDRYTSVEQVRDDVARAQRDRRFVVATDDDGAIVGCVRVIVDGERADFGPFAVLPSAQGRGIGSALLARVDALARDARCAHIEIEVVNHRTDLLPFYEGRGFERVGTAPCDAEHNCDEAQVTRPSHFVLMRKQLNQ
jgi:guanine deaminase